ncbi:DNA-binding transcriptional regulator, AcrR family [Sphingopyxis sp. YR583]|uniref:TetR/AcrR family transcriptional regulator n=1 Tax=Sphingopyxis sp. YR583 TaxID=1881047 RepID=UPI0008A72A76|nr:TetR/AcrR family transcriptional regulator [Sphingopyxis sp. YR583]SEH13984.1 DNA-binding transcriptional regulator, AcrR family [Sphingopyxis sp. YR583]
MTVARIDRETLFRQVWDVPLHEVAKSLRMTAGGAAKLCDRLQVPRPNRNYWRLSAAERCEARPPYLPSLQSPTAPGSEAVPANGLAGRRRLPIEARRAQMLGIAGRICLAEGIDEVSLNRVAREAGISEAQAHNCFARRIDMLSALARREIDEYERSRRGVVLRGRDRNTQIVMSTVNYLSEAGRRGALLQTLLLDPEVREIMREEFERTRISVSKPIVQAMASSYGMSEEEAFGSNWIVTAISLRAGSLVSAGRLTTENAIRLCLPMVMGSIRSHAKSHPRSRDA